MRFGSYILLCLLLSACTLGPDFQSVFTPKDKSAEYINTPTDDPENQKAISRWWERIDDPLLDGYVKKLLNENFALKESAERVIQARENLNIQRGDYAPSLSTSASAGRSFTPGNNSPLIGTSRQYTTSYNAGLDVSWQLDLFGKIRRSVESADASYEASIYDQQALIHTLIADLLNKRIAVATNKRLLELAKDSAENRQKIYDLVKNRYNLGVQGTSAADIYLSENNYKSAQADVHQFERLLADQSYRLDVLLGQTPGTTKPLESDFPVLPAPLDVATCLPADLLDRRPDLRASELRVKAANANIGIAIADLYPSLTLGGDIGFSSNETSNLFSAEQLAGSILSSITARLFEGGKLRANIRLRESETRELAAAYAGNVLEAMREVETALKSEKELENEVRELQASKDALAKAEQVSQDRYIRGIITLRDLLDTQQSLYLAEQVLLSKQQELWNNRITLYLALGGDWLGEQKHGLACKNANNKNMLDTEEKNI